MTIASSSPASSNEGTRRMSTGTGAMPIAVSQVFEPLSNELVGLHERWALYRGAFGLEEARIDLLNRVAGVFFGYTQWAMYLDVILSLCRLTDPAESSKKIGHRPNLTMDRLVNEVTADDLAFGGTLTAREWDAVKQWRDLYFEEIRSKRIAHNDLNKMTARFTGQPVGWPSREQVEQFLALCTSLMATVHQHYIGCPLMFDAFATDGRRSADSLLKVLAEFADRHDAEVMAGRRTWAISTPKGFYDRLRTPPPSDAGQ
jgi:hypothetical protein